MTERIRLYENLRAVSYTPFYLAESRGGFAAAGVEVEMVPSPRPEETAHGVVAGRVDVAFGGPMRVMLHHDRDPHCPLVCFCQVVGPDPFVLVGREARPGFRLADLAELRVGVVSEVPTPWLTLQDDLGRAGLDPATLLRGPARTMAANVAALEAGELDAVQAMEPHVERAVRGGAHVWHTFAGRGSVGFTTFYTTRAFLETRGQAAAALTRALATAVRDVYALPADTVAAAVAARFPDLDRATLVGAIERQRAARIWTPDPTLTASEFVRLKAALLSGGLIGRDVPFEHVVDNRFVPG